MEISEWLKGTAPGIIILGAIGSIFAVVFIWLIKRVALASWAVFKKALPVVASRTADYLRQKFMSFAYKSAIRMRYAKLSGLQTVFALLLYHTIFATFSFILMLIGCLFLIILFRGQPAIELTPQLFTLSMFTVFFFIITVRHLFPIWIEVAILSRQAKSMVKEYMKVSQGQATKETAVLSAEEAKSKRTLMEYMILNTLWTKQVNKWPDLSLFFSFSMNFPIPSENQAFREAGAKLVGEGLIAVAENGQYLLTINGFDYCKKHFKEFPPEQWWPEEQINKENLNKIISART
jgi:hypothetical protein